MNLVTSGKVKNFLINLFLEKSTFREFNELSENEYQTLLHIINKYRLEKFLQNFLNENNIEKKIFDEKKQSKLKKSDVHVFETIRKSKKIFEKLNEKKIKYVPLKGIALFYGNYQDPIMKQMRDIDILINKDKFKQVLKVLNSQGFYADQIDSKLKLSKDFLRYHLPIFRDVEGTTIDLHLKIHENNEQECLISKEFLKNVSIKILRNTEIYFPNINDLILNLIYHATKKHGFDNGPIYLHDLFKIISIEVIDFEDLIVKSEVYKLKNELLYSFVLLEKYYPINFDGKINLKALDQNISNEFEDLIFLNQADKRVQQFYQKGLISTVYGIFSIKKIHSEFGLKIHFLNYFYYLFKRIIRQIRQTMPSLFWVIFSSNRRKYQKRVRKLLKDLSNE